MPEPRDEVPGDPRRRRLVRRALRALLVLLGVGVGLVALALLLLASGAGRGRLCAEAEARASAAVSGEVSVGRCAVLALSRIRLEEVTVRSPGGAEVLALEAVTLVPDLRALLGGAIGVRELVLEAPRVSLAEEGGQLALAAALTPVEVGEEPPGERDPGSPTVVRVESIRIERGEVRDLPEGLALSGLALELGGRLDGHLEVELRSAEATLTRAGAGEVARLSRLDGVVRLAPGAASRLEAVVEAGEDRLGARLEVSWGEDGPEELEAEVALSVSAELLERLGQAQAAAALRGRVSGTVRASGRLEDLAVGADLETDGGPLTIRGRLAGDRAELAVETSGLEPSRLAEAAPEGTVSGRVSAAMEHVLGGAALRPFELELRDLRFQGYELRELRARGVLEPEALTLVSLEVPHLTGEDGRVDLTGRVGFDGSADLRLEAHLPAVERDPNLRRLVEGLRGEVTTSVRVRKGGGQAGRLEVEGRVAVAGLEAPGLTLRRAELRGTASGSPASPEVSVDLRAAGLRAGDLAVREAALVLRGGPSRYGLEGRAVLVDGRVSTLDLGVALERGTYLVDGQATARGLWDGPLRVRLRGLALEPEREVRLGRVELRGRGLEATAEGTYRFRGASSLEATVAELDLAALERALGLDRGLGGRASGELSFGGTPSRPEVRGRVELARGRLADLVVPEATVELGLSSREGTAALAAEVDLGAGAGLSARAAGELARGRDLLARLRSGSWQVSAEARRITPDLVRSLLPAVAELEGSLDLELEARGTVAEPEVRLEARVASLAAPGLEPASLDLAAGLAGGRLDLALEGSDARGTLVALSAQATVDLAALVGAPGLGELLAGPWSLRARLPGRSPRELPFAVPEHDALPEWVEAEVEVRGGEGQPVGADAALLARWAPLEGLGEVGCRGGRPPVVRVVLALRDGLTVVTTRAEVEGEEVAEVVARLVTPVDRWLREGGPEGLPVVAAEARVDLPLEGVPALCSRASGRLLATLEAEGVLSDSPRVELEGELRDLRLRGGAPVQLVLSAEVLRGMATASVRMRTEGRDAMVAEGRAPLRWPEGGGAPALGEEPWEATVRLRRAPVAPLLAAAPGISRPTGSLEGDLAVRGAGEDVSVTGEVTFEGLGLTVQEPFQRLDDLDGTVRFTDAGLTIEGLELRDRGGRLRLEGQVALERWQPRAIELAIDADRFPLREEGIILARATSRLRLEADLASETRQIRVTVLDTNVALADQARRGVQRLDQHPEVVYEDQPGFAAAEAPAEQEVAAAEPARPVVILVDATEPFWVRHAEFAVQLTADLRIETAEGGAPRISGPLGVRRGFLTLLGRTFDFERGELTFAGGATVDPLLDLRAVHALRSDETVTVQIGGRLSEPELTFSTTVPGVATEREILALLVTGRGGDPSATAEEEAVSMLASITAGLLSTLARRQFGGFVPVLAIESHGAAETRVRAGFQADRIIPRALRGVIRGVYVEGFVGTRQGEDGGQETGPAVTGGGAIELYFPHDLVTTGTYEEPDNWSVDLTWEP